jgi:predicted RNA-binding protein Jag
MRYEGKSEQDAVEQAARSLGKPAGELRYHVLRDEKSFWGGRVVEIEIEEAADPESAKRKAEEDAVTEPHAAVKPPAPAAAPREMPAPREATEPAATGQDAVAVVESTLTELLSAAGLLLDIRRRDASGDEILFELIGDDAEPLLANQGEG